MQLSSLFQLFVPLFILSVLASGQSSSLTLSSTSVQPGTSSTSLNLALANTATGGKPAGVQFSLAYSSSDFTSVSVSVTGVGTNMGKSIICAPVTGGQTCMIAGINNTAIGDGILASVSTVLGTSSNPTRSIQVTSPVAASTLGTNLPLTSTGGSVTINTPVTVSLSGISCGPVSLASGASSSCTVSLSGAATSSTVIALSSSNASLKVPASVTIAAGQSSAIFAAAAGTINTDSSAIVTAAFGGVSKTVSISLTAPAAVLSSVSCTVASLQGPASTTCSVKLSANAPAGGTVVNLVDNNPAVSIASKVTVAAGSSTASFSATAAKVAQIQPVVITATTGSVSVNTTLTVLPPTTLQSLSCTPANLAVRASANCTLQVSTPVTRNTSVTLDSSSAAVRTSSSVTIAAGRSSATFTATAISASSVPATITATVYETSKATTIRVGGNTTLSMNVIGEPSSVNGEAVNLQLEAKDEKDSYTALSVSNLPAGARFDASNGSFSWEPAGVANGSYAVTFSARNSSGTVENLEVMVDVASGAPVVNKLVHGATRTNEGACSAGSIAILEGMGLSRRDEDVQVLVNGNPVRVLKSNAKQIAIQCPELSGGTVLSIQTKRGGFWSNTLETVSVEAAPGILSLDRAGNEVEIRATGLGSEASLSLDKVQMMMGERAVAVTGVKMDEQGIFHVTVQMPEANEGGEVSMRLALRMNDGHVAESNAVKIFVEGRDGSDAVR